MSNEIRIDSARFSRLKDKVVVLTGGANGIGAAIVRLLHAAGAYVVFGDLAEEAAAKLIESLANPSTVHFVPTDVTSYAANVKLFKTAYSKYGRVDHAIACAGILEQGRWFDEALTIDTVAVEPPTVVLDVNLKAVLFFARIAIVYMQDGKARDDDKSLTMLSSAAGFRPSPGLPVYQSTKHGVMGILRSLRAVIEPRNGIRINNICPGITETTMTGSIIDTYRDNGYTPATADDVARCVLMLETSEPLNGKAVYVDGPTYWEIEDGISETMPQWLGEELTERIKGWLKLLASGDAWKVK